MRSCKYKLLSLFAVLIAGLLFSTAVVSETLEKEETKRSPGHIVIRSQSLQIDNKLKTVTFLGNVNAKRDDLIINCDEMLVFYENLADKNNMDTTETSIKKLVATGHVKIDRADGGSAVSEKAVYYQEEEKIILTGKPVAKQGDSFVEGDRITIFLKENRSVVESFQNKKVKAVIFPKRKKGSLRDG